MGFMKQLLSMLRLEYILMKRNLFLSFIEIFSPIILLFFFLFLRLLFSTKKESYKNLYKSDIEYIFSHSSNLTNNISPSYKLEDIKKDENSVIPYTYVLKQCKNIKHIALIGKYFPEEIKNKLKEHFWELEDPLINENNIFKYFDNVEEFNKYISSKEYGTNDINPEICFGISKTDLFQFGIHYKGIDINNQNDNELEELLSKEKPNIPSMKSDKKEKIRNTENLKFFEQYKNSGYLMVLKIIYDYFLQKITEDNNAYIQYSIIGMKFDEIFKDNFHNFLSLLGFFIIISYSIPMSINIYKQINLVETEKKEYLKIMGINDLVFFVTNFIKAFIINIFHTIFNALIVYGALKQSQYGYLFIIFFFFGLVIFSMTYFFQSFLKVSRLGVIISLLIFCIMSFFYIPMYSPVINPYLRYFICIILPPTNLQLGLNSFYAFEQEYSPLNNRIKLDVAEINIELMISLLIVNFFLYIFLGFIITQLTNCGKKVNYEKQKKNSINDYYDTEENTNSSFSISNKSNPPPKNEINLGENYIESDDEIDIGIQFNDYINSKANNQDDNKLNKKLENLKKSIFKINKNKIDINNNKENPYFQDIENISEIDEIEFDIDNLTEARKLRNLRRTTKSIMYHFDDNEENNIKNDLKFSNIQYALEESVSDSLKNMVNLIGDKNNDNIFNIENESLKNKNQIKKEKDIISEDMGVNNKKEENNKNKETKKKKKKNIKEKKEQLKEGSRIIVSGLTKIYEKNTEPILNDISFKLYQDEIFALLGQNGEGKSTFVSILTGLKQATSGSIIYQKDKESPKLEILTNKGIKSIRKKMGICNQNNIILYEDLTVSENLEIFSEFKSEEKIDIGPIISELIQDFNLQEKANYKVSKLSGGEKRKLVIASAFCGESEIIILDEPTGGIDLITKKEIWEALKKRKQNKIILLITHYMDEAWELADRCGILKNGKIIFNNDKDMLTKTYGKYINIQINKKIDKKLRNLPADIEKKFILKNKSKSGTKNIISETGSDSGTLISNTDLNTSNTTINLEKVEFKEYKERALIKIPKVYFDYKKSNDLLKLIEEEYGIKNYFFFEEFGDDLFINAVNDKKNINDKKDYLLFSDENNYNRDYYDSYSKFKNELKIMLYKRLYETFRDKKSFILEILFPILLTLISCLICYYEILEDNISTSLYLNNMDKNQQSIFYYASNGSNYEEFGNILSSEIKEEQKDFENINFQYIPNVLEEKDFTPIKSLISYYNVLYEYAKKENIKNNTGGFHFVKADKTLHQYEFDFFISSKKKHITIYLTNYLLRTIIRYEMKRSRIYKPYMNNIQITNCPFPLTYKEKNDKKNRNGFSLVFFISIALSLIPANFITIIIREKQNKSKHLQILSGASIYIYWINNYIFELIKYYFVVGICLIILWLFNFYENYLYILYIFYGPALVSFTYVLSYLINTEGTGQIVILLLNLFFGSLCGSAILILRTNKNLKIFAMILSYILRIIPSFCICYGYNQLISKKILFAIDKFESGEDNNINIEKIKKEYNDFTFLIKEGIYLPSDIIYLFFEIIIYTLLLIFLENKEYFLWKFGLKKIDLNYSYNNSITSSIESKNSEKEKKNKKKSDKKNNGITSKVYISKADDISGSGLALEVKKLCKSYNKKNDKEGNIFINFIKYKFCKKGNKEIKLDKIYLKVSNGECFCLLGRNASGKTTSFKCFSKEIEPDSGNIIIDDIDIKDFTKKQPIIGYCPQFDCIFGYLTTRENLNFYARLKGIKEEHMNKIINTLLDKLDLKKYENKLANILSGGNKRKLSVGISLLCKPVIIFMDEPSTGMDPYSRQLLLDLLHKAYLKRGKKKENNKKRAIVLISHLIQEAELIGDKIGILHNRKIVKRGKIYDLIQKEDDDIILNVEFKKISNTELKEKYGDIVTEKVKNSNDINNFLYSIKKSEYAKFITKDKFGKDIFKGIKKRGWAKKIGILKLIKYLDLIFLLSSKIKKYFRSIICINYSLNNFVFKIIKDKDEDKCNSRLFGIIEECKEECKIIEYTYEFANLEKIFMKYTTDETKESRNSYNDKIKQSKFNISIDQ